MAVKVRMFCDWDNTSQELIDRLKAQTVRFDGDTYRDIEFTAGDDYDFAIVFNYPEDDYGVPQANIICLVLEPPEIYPIATPKGFKIYSFANDAHEPAYGIGFATVPADQTYSYERKKLAMICSNKVLTEYHLKRQEIFRALLDSDIDMDFYGRGMGGSDPRIKGQIAPMGKHYVLPKYDFVIDFENSPRNVVTDKFFDPILCGTVPVTNSKWLNQNYAKSCVYLDFELPTDQIVTKIRTIVDEYKADDYFPGLKKAQRAITSGEMSLADWICDRITEL